MLDGDAWQELHSVRTTIRTCCTSNVTRIESTSDRAIRRSATDFPHLTEDPLFFSRTRGSLGWTPCLTYYEYADNAPSIVPIACPGTILKYRAGLVPALACSFDQCLPPAFGFDFPPPCLPDLPPTPPPPPPPLPCSSSRSASRRAESERRISRSAVSVFCARRACACAVEPSGHLSLTGAPYSSSNAHARRA